MSKFYSFLIAILLLLSIISSNSFSQEFGFGRYYTGSRDFVEISYGIGNLKHKKIATN
jgi:hypothetical protein